MTQDKAQGDLSQFNEHRSWDAGHREFGFLRKNSKGSTMKSSTAFEPLKHGENAFSELSGTLTSGQRN
ncbi:MAG: hypothetical protein FWD31_05785 [Planctomycetaceae bacterium]|nr:hypothetical protein [Planctomycetaceae bacterium]